MVYFESKFAPTELFSGATGQVDSHQRRKHGSPMIQVGIKEAKAAVGDTGAAGAS
jgi:hypothetical protein